jgi:hypothetical protein
MTCLIKQPLLWSFSDRTLLEKSFLSSAQNTRLRPICTRQSLYRVLHSAKGCSAKPFRPRTLPSSVCRTHDKDFAKIRVLGEKSDEMGRSRRRHSHVALVVCRVHHSVKRVNRTKEIVQPNLDPDPMVAKSQCRRW